MLKRVCPGGRGVQLLIDCARRGMERAAIKEAMEAEKALVEAAVASSRQRCAALTWCHNQRCMLASREHLPTSFSVQMG